MNEHLTTEHPVEHLVDARTLLKLVFGQENAPSIRWLQYQIKRRTIPYYQIGGMKRFDPAAVRTALEKNCLVAAKGVCA